MLSMLKLLATTLLLSSTLFASSKSDRVEDFLEQTFHNNPAILELKVKVVDEVPIKELKGWSGVIVSVDALVNAKPKARNIKQKMIWFTNGEVITKDLTDMSTGESFTQLVAPSFKSEYYKDENRIYGNANAKHKVAIFSDPLCPFCRSFVPGAIKEIKKSPDKFALYYYNYPLKSLHPASEPLVKAAIAAELKGVRDVTLNLYKIKINPKEKNINKILAAFNATMKTDIKPSDLKSPAVLKFYNDGLDLASELMVQGTPTVYFDGKLDRTKKAYKKVK
jgi:thiol:disulfide interchange protein DsbC